MRVGSLFKEVGKSLMFFEYPFWMVLLELVSFFSPFYHLS